MVITVTCPSCSSAFPVDPAKIPEGGVNARCSSCGDIFRVEKPADPPPIPTFEEVAPVEEAAPVVPEAPPEAEPYTEAPAVDESLPAEPEPEVAAEPEVVPEPEVEPEPEVVAEPEPDFAAEPEVAPEPAVEPEPEVVADPVSASDPFSETAPFESAGAGGVEPEAATSGGGVQGFTFGKRDPTDKAKRLARVLVSDMIMYNAERHQSALSAGTLVQDFEEEIDKSWKEYVEQVGDELAQGAGRGFWTEALNDILAKGEQVF